MSKEPKKMSEEIKQKHFKPKAHILTLLGEELIKSPVMAIYELVKNSYDADANKVNVYFHDVDDIEKSSIIIEDDGIGMTSEIVEDVWLEPGSDFRKPINKEGNRQIIKSPIYERIPMGEKGVGRFAVHKLGTKILLISRPKIIVFNEDRAKILSQELADYEIELYINWKDFNQSRHLSDIPIKWKIRRDTENFRFKNTSGTYIRLSGLKENWTRGMARDLKRQTLSMLSPRINENSFRINLNFNNQWLSDFPTASKIIQSAPYKISAFLDSNFDLIFEYQFSLENNTSIGTRTIKEDSLYDKNIRSLIKPKFREQLEKKEISKTEIEEILKEFDTGKNQLPFGSLYFEFFSFDLDTPSLRDYTDSPEILRSILKENAGVKVYKGDLRVFDYGEKGDDWLGFDIKRVNNKEWFSNNQNIGHVYLDPENSTALVEKTNREGFVENEAYNMFIFVLDYILTEIKTERLKDRNKWLLANRKTSRSLFDDRISNFKRILNSSDLDNEGKKQKLLEEAENLEKSYEEDKKMLLIPAGVGMTASVALHEIEKLVPRMEETVKSTPIDTSLIKDQVDELKQYTDGILSVLRKGGDKAIDLSESINRAFKNYKTKFSDRKIEYTIDIDENATSINCDKRFFITILMNILDNSIYWLDTVNKNFRGIYLKATKTEATTTIVIADNGIGFKDDISELIRPFFSRKSDGIGIGLYLVDTIMLKYGKFDIITSSSELKELNIPEEYNGAITKLVFNKNQN